MSDGVNKWIGVGVLGADAEVKGESICRFRIACNESWVDKSGKKGERTLWMQCVKFNAARLAPHLTKGLKVYVEGPIVDNEWEDKDGNKRSRAECHVRELRFLGEPRGRQQKRGDDDDDDTMPW